MCSSPLNSENLKINLKKEEDKIVTYSEHVESNIIFGPCSNSSFSINSPFFFQFFFTKSSTGLPYLPCFFLFYILFPVKHL